MARILVIDDKDEARSILRKHLAGAGHDVVEASDGRTDMQLLEASAVDLVVTDLYMPEMDGIEFYEEFRRTFPELASHILFVSAFADHPEVQAFLRRTGRPVVAKPYEIAEFVQTVQRLAAGR